MKKLILFTALLMFLGMVVYAQNENETGKNELMIWGGFSPDSTTIIKGTCRTPDARFGIVAFRYSRRFNTGNFVNLKYTSDFVPFAALNYPDFETLPTVPPSIKSYRPTRTGYGIAPLGLQINFRPHTKYQPFIGASGGLLYLNKQTPNLVGTRFIYTAEVNAGLEIKLKDKRAVSFGYKYYHISNGGRGLQNPGFDNNLFYVGYTYFSK